MRERNDNPWILRFALAVLLGLAMHKWGHADETPPFSQDTPAASENARTSALVLYGHRHDGTDSAFLRDILPETDSAWSVGASGREWLNGYFDNIFSTTFSATSGTFTNLVTTTITATQVNATSITLNGLNYAGNPVGTVVMYVAAAAPSGWVLCDGSSLSTTTYSRLFAVIGTTYGGAGANFNVPDFRGVFPKGAGTTNRAAGKDSSGNFYAATIGTYATDMMQGHYHNVLHYGTEQTTLPTTNAGVSGNSSVMHGSGANDSQQIEVRAPRTDGTNGTPRTGHTTEPQSVGISFIIYTGI